ncbi:hypothetical protein EJB05_09945, partial [Eragrostis curvula]
MDSVLSKLNDLVRDTFTNLIGMSKDILFLREELTDMNALLKKLEDNEQLDPQVKNWRNQVLEMAYDIEDCIDDFKNNVRSADAKDSLIGRFSDFLKTLRACFGTAMQIKELKTRLQDMNDRRKRYKVDDCTSSSTIETLDPRLPALYNEAANLVGIDNPKEELIKWVLDENQKLKVVSIVGTGGLGKTTLANEVYHESGVQFNCKAFVPVSRTPDMTRILNGMLSQLQRDPISHAYDVQYLIDSLRKHLHDKRYLIIVDDLWDVPPWDTIKCAFPANNQQSRVIITTRRVDVARACCTDHRYIHYLQPLSDTNSRTLFFKRISVSEDDSHSFHISEAVLGEILKKCGGLPLAIITISSILACQQPGRQKEQWECIQNSLAIQSATNPILEQMVQILDLSYKSLPHHLKSCFLYLGKFPEDYQIRKDDLIRQWVAECFVTSSPGRDVWDIAEGYFNALVNRSMIQPVYPEFGTEVLYCKVHDMMLDLILRRCGEDNFLVALRDPQEVAEVKYKVRRLSFDMSGPKDVTMTVATTSLLSQVRSLAMFGGANWIPSLLEFKFLRVLRIESHKHIHKIDLTCIIHLSQLRYLNIVARNVSNGQIIQLPNQMRRLQHLETFELLAYSCIDVSIPSDIVDLPHLSHLAVPCNTRLPAGIGNANSLRTLVGFSLQRSSSDTIRTLGMLTKLVEMVLACGEWTNSERMLTATCALSSALEKLSNLKRICMFGPCRGDAMSLSSFSPAFNNLERLEMLNVTFPRVPGWISCLHDLHKCDLAVDEIYTEDVGILGTLPSLAYLKLQIRGVPAERIVIAGSTGFIVLQVFGFDCDGISRLTFEAGAMPKLWELRLFFDPREWDKAPPAGLEHLLRLKLITAWRAGYAPKENIKEVEEATGVQIRGVF